MRKRFENNYPDSNLLRDPEKLLGVVDEHEAERIRTWSLYGSNMGLAIRIKQCFDDPRGTSEEYYDLVDRTLYCFKLANPLPVHEGKSATYTVNKRNEETYIESLKSTAGTVGESSDSKGPEASEDISVKNMWEMY